MLNEAYKKYDARPLLKWAGGKTQMLGQLLPKVPTSYNRYIEPFFGGGALFFELTPSHAVISDSNPELINLYQQVADNVDVVIECLKHYANDETLFYTVRSQNWMNLSRPEAAARTIFLNKTCFNGLYRVNQGGQFNVPFGKYKNPKLCDQDTLYAAADALQNTQIICGDYLSVLNQCAQPDDFIFLDPPYMPISEYSDFKRYTKEQFSENDHIQLAKEVRRLSDMGCYVLLTNSNHPLVHELYRDYPIDVIQTKRYISCNGSGRKGEDVIITATPSTDVSIKLPTTQLPTQLGLYPSTRFMGSKSKLLPEIWAVASRFDFDSVLDLFSGSGIVGYMFKSQGKTVISNDYMAMSSTFTKAMIENNKVILPMTEAKALLLSPPEIDRFVENTFRDLYFSTEDNQLIDRLRCNILTIKNQYKRAIAMSALIRACIKKRPRGIFTYVGERYNDGRKDLKKSFEEQFLQAVEVVNNAVFDNGRSNRSKNLDAILLRNPHVDLVYIDPPYYSPYSDNEYVRRYHFVEGLARNWDGVEIQEHTITKKIKSYPTPFSTRNGAYDAFDHLFKKYATSILIVSYSSNSLPSLDEMVSLLSKYKQHVDVIPVDYRYSFGNQATRINDNKNMVQEYLFAAY